MPTFEIIPHTGIGPVRLGASRDDICAALGAVGFAVSHASPTMDYFCENAIQVEYGDDGLAEFIGCACHRTFTLTYYGTNVFDLPAEELFALIAARDDSGPHVYDDNEYRFPNQILTLWDADSQYDRLGGEQRPVWAQVGLGNQRYLAAVLKIEAGT